MITAMLLMLATLAPAVEAVTLGAGAWTIASSAAELAGNESLRRLVRALESNAGAIMVIRHAGGEADSTRAESVRTALVALGIPSARVRLEPAAAAAQVLILELAVPGASQP